MGAKDALVAKEFSFLSAMQQEIAEQSKALTLFAEYIARLDLYTAQALLAKEKRYCKPELSENGRIVITEGRHPVIEEFLPRDQQFIPNNLTLNGELKIEN